MKTQSNTKPEMVVIKPLDAMAILIFAENTIEEKGIEQPIYTYDEYRLSVPLTPNLEKRVQGNSAEWLKKAKQAEYDAKAKEVREKRNKLIAETDYMFLADQEALQTESVKAYRQSLRDITKQVGFPEKVNWPKKV